MNAFKTATIAVLLLALILATAGTIHQQGISDADEPTVEAGGSSLTSVYIPDSATSISAGAFTGCEKLRFVTIPSTVTSIGAGAFSGCPELTSLTFIGDSDVVLVGDSQIFDDPKNVTIINATDGKTVTISEDMVGGKGMTKIEPGAAMFYYGNEWVEAYMFTFDGDSVKTVVWKGLYRGALVIPSNVTVVCDGANNQMFGFDKDWIQSVIIPDGVTTIGNNAFSGCAWMKSAPLPATVTTIGKNAFANCSSLQSMELPGGVTTIGWNAFLNCSTLTEISIPEMTEDISGAFQGCKGLKTVVLPYDLRTIGESAFYNCTSLSSIDLPDELETISAYAFYGCSSLGTVKVPSTVATIGERAFEGCSSLETLDVSEGLVSIGPRAFAGCTSLGSVTIPVSVGEIGAYAFSNCMSLENIDVQRRATLTIGEYAFPLNSVISVDFYGENGVLMVSNYYKHGTFEYKTLANPGFYRTAI